MFCLVLHFYATFKRLQHRLTMEKVIKIVRKGHPNPYPPSCNGVVKSVSVGSFNNRCMEQFEKLGIAPLDADKVIDMPNRSVFGTRPLDQFTKASLMGKVRAFVAFCLDNGCYDDSMLIFHPLCPKGVVAVEDRALVAFLHVVYTPEGETARDQQGVPFLNAKGEEMVGTKKYCDWHAPDNMDQLLSAMRHIHQNCHGMGDTYVEKCNECASKYEKKESGGCRSHPIPRYTRLGNVSASTAVKDTVQYLKNTSVHIVRGSCHLLPSEVRMIREHAAASNNLWLMEIFTLLLTSIELFLRKREYSSLHSDNFNTDMFLLTDDFVIEALNVSVKGKRKNTKERRNTSDVYACWRKLWIFGDDLVPDLDLKRNLLAFLYAINWKGGFLFPSRDEIANPPDDGIYKTFIQEDELILSLKDIFKGLLERDDKLTTHAGRKTGYLWSRIRGGSIQSTMTCADHAQYNTAKRYMKDADAVANIIKRVGDEKEQLGVFHSCHCAVGTQTSNVAMRPVAQYQVPLKDLVVGFLESKVGICPKDPRSCHPKFLMEKILRWRKPDNASNQLASHLAHISTDKTDAIMACVNTMVGRAVQKTREECKQSENARVETRAQALFMEFQGFLASKAIDDDNEADVGKKDDNSGASIQHLFNSFLASKGHTTTHTVSPIKRVREESVSIGEPTKKREKRGQKTILGREKFRAMNTHQKLTFILQNYDPIAKDYMGGCRVWLQRTKKTYECLVGCYNRDVDLFSQHHCPFINGDVSKCEVCSRK